MITILNKHTVLFAPPDEAVSLIGDFTDWKQAPLSIAGPLTLAFPEGAYIEYAFLGAGGQPLADPDNPGVPDFPRHSYDRSIALPGNTFRCPPRSQHLHGKLLTHTLSSQILRSTRTCFIYEPPVFSTITLYV